MVVFSRVADRLGSESDGKDATRCVAGFLHEVFCKTAFNNDVKMRSRTVLKQNYWITDKGGTKLASRGRRVVQSGITV
jgi:hypothetical protein